LALASLPTSLGWGVIGCGDVVERKSGPSIEHAGRSRMVTVMRRTAEAAQDFARRHGVERWTADAAAVIADANVDIVYVATPPASHLEYVLAAAAAGKHVLVEKPMALNAGQADTMVAACTAAGVQLFVAYYRRFQPHVVRVRQLLHDGVIGRPVQARIDIANGDTARRYASSERNWRDDPAVSGGGGFVDEGSHRLDVMVSLLGPVARAYGVAATVRPDLQVEQAASAICELESGAVCVATGDFYSGRSADRLAIRGEQGAIIADPLDGHAFRLTVGNREEEERFTPFPAPHLGLIRHVEEVLLGTARNAVSGSEGAITETILDQVVRQPPASVVSGQPR
jgi:1,5-anhydro-D-fructose reductase (1,5-anhydro-D-mannitol-forming)